MSWSKQLKGEKAYCWTPVCGTVHNDREVMAAAGHMVSIVRKQRVVNDCAQLTFSFPFDLVSLYESCSYDI